MGRDTGSAPQHRAEGDDRLWLLIVENGKVLLL